MSSSKRKKQKPSSLRNVPQKRTVKPSSPYYQTEFKLNEYQLPLFATPRKVPVKRAPAKGHKWGFVGGAGMQKPLLKSGKGSQLNPLVRPGTAGPKRASTICRDRSIRRAALIAQGSRGHAPRGSRKSKVTCK